MNQIKGNLVYLTGFMSSGKSTLAPFLAQKLGFGLIDIDREIESSAGQTVPEIFRTLGESYFRRLERAILANVSKREGYVVSLGGGTITHADNLHVVKSTGILVYLKARPEAIFQRVRLKTDRPLLDTVDGKLLTDEELDARIRHLLAEREPLYAQADITIVTDDKPVNLMLDELADRIRKFNEKGETECSG
ncbi:MAG: shikimate kinase [Bacteroidota bacterium]|jgi:shikimate kinase